MKVRLKSGCFYLSFLNKIKTQFMSDSGISTSLHYAREIYCPIRSQTLFKEAKIFITITLNFLFIVGWR